MIIYVCVWGVDYIDIIDIFLFNFYFRWGLLNFGIVAHGRKLYQINHKPEAHFCFALFGFGYINNSQWIHVIYF